MTQERVQCGSCNKDATTFIRAKTDPYGDPLYRYYIIARCEQHTPIHQPKYWEHCSKEEFIAFEVMGS